MSPPPLIFSSLLRSRSAALDAEANTPNNHLCISRDAIRWGYLLPLHFPLPPSSFSSLPSSSQTSSQWRQLRNSQRSPHPYYNPISTPPPPSSPHFVWQAYKTQTIEQHRHWRHALALRRGYTYPRRQRSQCIYKGGCEGTSAKEANGLREWLSAAAMTVDGGVAVGLWLCFMTCSVKTIQWSQNEGCQCTYIQY